MAFPLKAGVDLYNTEALNMRLHNFGKDLDERGTGTIYFNTGSDTNHSKHAVVYDGTKFKALAYVDEIANNDEFKEVKRKVDAFFDGTVDVEGVIDNLEDIQKFLNNYSDATDLATILSGKVDKTELANYLPLSGGTIKNKNIDLFSINRAGGGSVAAIGYYASDVSFYGYLGFDAVNNPIWADSNYERYPLIHSGNIKDFKAGGLQTSAGDDAVLVNSSGNVTIGNTQDDGSGAKLQVNGRVSAKSIWIKHNTGDMASYGAFLCQYITSGNANSFAITARNADTSFRSDMIVFNWGTGNILLGKGTDNGKGKVQVEGDLHVSGNIIATGQVSARGAAEEGSSAGSGAEVEFEIMTPGNSSYSFENKLARTDIICTLYENVTVGSSVSWDMCLADISVTASTITVTFGSATNVVHKLVYMG